MRRSAPSRGRWSAVRPLTRHSATSEPRPRSLSQLVAEEALDAELAALLWIMAEAGTPLVVAAAEREPADELRGAVAELASAGAALADMRLPGRTVTGARTLEDVLEQVSPAESTGADGLSDAARELGLVVVVGRTLAAGGAGVSSAHYLRPIERDAAGHLQRRPPAVLAAWNDRAQEFDHFDWGISEELATRARMSVAEMVRLQRQRATLLAAHGRAGSDAPN